MAKVVKSLLFEDSDTFIPLVACRGRHQMVISHGVDLGPNLIQVQFIDALHQN